MSISELSRSWPRHAQHWGSMLADVGLCIATRGGVAGPDRSVGPAWADADGMDRLYRRIGGIASIRVEGSR